MVTAPAKQTNVAASADVSRSTDPIVLRLPDGVLTDDLLIEISHLNEPLHFERNTEGALEISPPPGTRSGIRGGQFFYQIMSWSESRGDGQAFPAASGFHLPDGAARDADAAWISRERLEQVDTDDEKLWLVCPELVVEVRSRGQTLRKQQEKMLEWMSAGVRLGWLIDPYTDEGVAWVYREGQAEPERLGRPDSLSGEDVAEGLAVDLTNVWR